MTAVALPDDIVSFWMDAGPDKWFRRDDSFDRDIRARFLSSHEAAAARQLMHWGETAQGALALLLLLDQFPRNMFRDSARAFATDPLAREIADAAIGKGFDRAVAPEQRGFFYLPFMHSEELADQERCIELYRAAADQSGLKWADLHADIVRRFGRFPHRNPALGRKTTPEEQAFLDGGGFKG